MRNIVAAFKLLYFGFFLANYMFVGFIFSFFINIFPIGVRKILSASMTFALFMCRKPLGVNVKFFGKPELLRDEHTKLIVSNHMSYIDAIILCPFIHANFITSVEIHETPVLGKITEMGGCLYVERRNKERIQEEIQTLSDSMDAGLNIYIFPEATSTNGEELHRFRRPLFNCVLNGTGRVLPITIRYKMVDGKPVTKANRDLLCWYGDMSFFPHFWSYLKTTGMLAEVHVHDYIIPEPDWDMTLMAAKAQEVVATEFEPITD
jgi:1-acyl-sn-glycerol-3-phosphate acyltransferase